MGQHLLGLSLFIMLLAFFIVLNAISSFEQTKVRPVMESLGETFAAKISQEGNDQPSPVADSTQSNGEGDTLDRLEALFRAQIPSVDAVVSKSRGVMYVRVPYSDFEAAITAIGQTQAPSTPGMPAGFAKSFFLPTLVSLLQTDRTGLTLRMDALVNMKDNPAAVQAREPQRMAQTMAQLGRLADKLERSGLPAKQQSIGVQQGPDGTVDLLFQPYVPFNPLGEDE
jgi:hypothetical protein